MEKKLEKVIGLKLILLGLLIFLGTFTLSMTMIRSGIERDYGIGFWGPNGHDGVWHLALQNQVEKKSPPQNPVFAGETLVNYHYFYDSLVVAIGEVSGFSNSFVYFQLMPVLMAVLIGGLSFLVGFYWSKNFWVGFWLAFLNYFAGSLGWLVTLFRSAEIGGESLFWSMQSISTLINPPFALSLVLILFSLLLLVSKKGKSVFWMAALILGLVVNVKAYSGPIVLVGLFFYCLRSFFKNKNAKVFLVWLFALSVFFLTFVLKNRQSASLFEFNPFWFVNSMIESSGRLFIPKLASARYNLALAGVGPKLVLIELFAIFVFILGNMGTRIFSFWAIGVKMARKKLDELDWFLVSSMVVGFFIPLFFTQKGTAWNTIQFFYYFLFFANFYFAAFLSNLSQKITAKKGLVVLILLVFTLPTTYSTVRGYFGSLPATYLPSGEVEALKFLENQPDGIVLTFPYDKYKKQGQEHPLPIRDYETTAYVSAYSGKPVYLEDEMNNEITGFDWQERKRQANDFFVSQDPIVARGFLLNNSIDYIYLADDQEINLSLDDLGLKMIFSSQQARILKVSR